MLYRLENVAKSFGSKDVLVDATWQHDPGRVVGLVGRNGAGKTTVLRIVEGVLEPEAGRRLVAGTTTFASLEQAVEPEGSEALRAFFFPHKPRHRQRYPFGKRVHPAQGSWILGYSSHLLDIATAIDIQGICKTIFHQVCHSPQIAVHLQGAEDAACCWCSQ